MQSQLGKFLLVVSLCVQGNLLLQGLDAKANFDKSLASVASSIPQLACISEHTAHFDIVRYTIAGLYFTSILTLVTPCCCGPFLTIIGVALLTFIQQAPALLVNYMDLIPQIVVLKNLAIVAGLLYIAGSSCQKKIKGAVAQQKKVKQEWGRWTEQQTNYSRLHVVLYCLPHTWPINLVAAGIHRYTYLLEHLGGGTGRDRLPRMRYKLIASQPGQDRQASDKRQARGI